MVIVSSFLQGLGLIITKKKNTTSHYNMFPIEHKWELQSMPSGNKRGIVVCFSTFKLFANQPFSSFLFHYNKAGFLLLSICLKIMQLSLISNSYCTQFLNTKVFSKPTIIYYTLYSQYEQKSKQVFLTVLFPLSLQYRCCVHIFPCKDVYVLYIYLCK